MGLEELFILNNQNTINAFEYLVDEITTSQPIQMNHLLRIVLPLVPLIIAFILIRESKRLKLENQIFARGGGTALLLVYSITNIEALVAVKSLNFASYGGLLAWFLFLWILMFYGIKSSVVTTKLATKHLKLQKHKSIGIFGTTAAGKTTFIAALAEMIWSGEARPHWNLEIPEGLSYIRDVIKTIKKGEWPAGTYAGTKEAVELRIVDDSGIRKHNHRLYMNDIAGEEFQDFIKNPSLENLPETLVNINKCQGFMILIDPERAGDESYDYHNLIEYLVKIKGLKEKEKLDEVFAFVFTKNDLHNISNPKRFAEKSMPPLYNAYKIRLQNDRAQFFTCSSVGRVNPETRNPLTPIEPVGLDEPIEWLIEKLNKVKVREVSKGAKKEIEEQLEEIPEGSEDEEAWGDDTDTQNGEGE